MIRPDAPVVAVGLSMGVMVSMLACGSNPRLFDGLIAASAPLGPVMAGRVAILAATLLGRLLPGIPLETGIDVSCITDNKDDLEAYVSDPHFRTRTRMGLASDLLKATKQLRVQAGELQLPTLFLHGSRDRIAPWAEDVETQLVGAQRVVKVFEQGHHNLFLDTARHDVFDAIIQWMSALCAHDASRRGRADA